MKKSLFLAVFLLMTTMSFANVVKDKLYTAVDNEAVASLQKTMDIFATEQSIDDNCSASCYGDIYYRWVYN